MIDSRMSGVRSPRVDYRSFAEFVASDEFCRRGSVLHTGLLPMPFVGSLSRAKVFLLMLNPGLSPTDYFGEFDQPAYRSALWDNLIQTREREFPFVFLNPFFSWHDGFRYWHTKLKSVLEALSATWAVPYHDTLSRAASLIASIELLPYHSAVFDLSKRRLTSIPSVGVVQYFVQKLSVRASRGEVTIIVGRSSAMWRLVPSRDVVVYSGAEARAAHLTLTVHSRGGEAILRRLVPAFRSRRQR
jgi:hypothetical protein